MKTNDELKNTPNLLIARTTPDGGCGEIFQFGKRWASVIWSNGAGWEHVSIARSNALIFPLGTICANSKICSLRRTKPSCSITRQRVSM